MKKVLSLLVFVVISQIAFSQTYTISGYVIDLETGETLIGATIMVEEPI
jgi:hypothetical protein